MDSVQKLEESVKNLKMSMKYKESKDSKYKTSQEVDHDRQTLIILERELQKAKDARLLNG